MRINLTKKDLVNLIYMQLGFSKQISEMNFLKFKEIIMYLDFIGGLFQPCLQGTCVAFVLFYSLKVSFNLHLKN